jgi:hypothetical protein
MQIYVCNNTVSQLWQLQIRNEVAVPNVSSNNSSTLAAAENELIRFGFVPKVVSNTSCFEGHSAIGKFRFQEPLNQ